MRGRRGGILGVSPAAGFGGELSGLWRASEIYAMRVLDAWPRRSLAADLSPGYIDATQSGSGEFYASIGSQYEGAMAVWQKSVDSGLTWTNVKTINAGSGLFSDTLSLSSLTVSNDEDKYRVLVFSGIRTSVSSIASVRFDAAQVIIDSQPQSQSVPSGSQAFFWSSASAIGVKYGGSYTPSYQWQFRTFSGGNWIAMSGQTSDSILVNATSMVSGYQYRVVATALGVSVESNAATLTVT